MTRRSLFGWLVFFEGTAGIGLSIYTFLNPSITQSSYFIFYCLIAGLSGLIDLIFYTRLKRTTGFGPAIVLISAVFSFLLGFLLWLHRFLGWWLFRFSIAAWFVCCSLSRIAAYSYITNITGRFAARLSLSLHVCSLLLANILLFDTSLSQTAFGHISAIILLIHGINHLIEGIGKLGK